MAKGTRSTTSQSSKGAASKKSATPAKKGGSKAVAFDEETLLKELFLDELKDIYWAEKHLTKALPKMRKACTSEELASAFENHLAITEEQIVRLEEVFELMDEKARAIKCEGMTGLVQEGQKVMEDTPKGSAVRDAGLIISGQKIEHYEIAAYGSLVQLAKTMGRNDVAEILQVTLDEEKEADVLLTELAVSGININADNESE
jgi:ferritin-like metal-binding protein YciE